MARQRSDRSADGLARAGPLKPLRTILDEELREAEQELARPAIGLFLSGLLAGIGMGFSVLLIASVLTRFGPEAWGWWRQFAVANAYTVGFIVVILARTDLFTEYTTIAILPVLDGRTPLRRLVRLWGLVLVGNLLGTAISALVLVNTGPALGTAESWAFVELASQVIAPAWWAIVLSSILAGWLMGLLSWLVVSARETISQVFLIWLVTFVIGFVHLHHSVTGSAEVLAGLLVTLDVSPGDYGYFLGWTTLGNVIGGVVFAVLIRSSALLGETREDGGRAPRKRPAADTREGARR